ncbi:MAG: DNA polymerase Y family protein, partial [Thermoguttaceae bacterium]
MKRILCIQLPNWPIQRLRAARPELEGRPLALSRSVRGGERVFACSHEAAALGVVREQPIAEVKGLTAAGAGMTVLPHDAEADRAALAWWAEQCEQFSPLVGMDDAPQPDSLLLDVTATARLFGGEAALARAAVDRFARRRLRVRAAAADTPAGAWAVAHFHGAFLLERSPIHLVPPGETPEALRLLPIEALRLPERTVELLHELGIDLVGQLAALPREELSSRFGPELLRQWDRATGVRAEPIRAVRPPSEFAAVWEAEQPVRRRDMIHAALEQAVERLAADLLAAGRGATRVECRFHCLPDGRQAESEHGLVFRALRFSVGLFRPTADVQHLLGLLHLQLEREPLPGPVAGVEVAARETGPLVHRQMPLFAAGR